MVHPFWPPDLAVMSDRRQGTCLCSAFALHMPVPSLVRVCVRVRVRARVRARVLACGRACVRAGGRVSVRACAR